VRLFRYAIELVLAGLGLVSAAMFYDSYWRWRDCFNEMGRCFDPVTQNVYLEQAGLVWGSFTALFLGTAVALVALRRL